MTLETDTNALKALFERANRGDDAAKMRIREISRLAVHPPGPNGARVGDEPAFVPGGAGDLFANSKQYQDWRGRFPDGGPALGGNFSSDPFEIAGGFRTLIDSLDTSAGALVPPQQLGTLDTGLYRPVRLLQLVSTIPVTSDAVQYSQEKSHVSAAVSVAEATAATGTSGTKPEGGIAWDPITQAVHTFAVQVPSTRQVIADAGQLRGFIDAYLTADLARAVEDAMLLGVGGDNLLGILHVSGIQTQAAPGSGESNFDVIRKAKTKVEVGGRTSATAVVINPNDNESLDLAKINSEVNRFVADPFADTQGPLFGMPRVVTDAIPAKTALVGDFRKAILFDRESVTMMLGTINDDFIRNIVRVLAEARVGFGVVRPAAFVAVTLA